MEWERVAAVTGADRAGSGYVIGPSLVLTSAHVVDAEGVAVRVCRPGRAGDVAGRVVWCGTPGGRDDAALVRIEDPAWEPLADQPVPWGRSVTYRPGIECVCWGAPELVQREGDPLEVSQLAGTLNPGDRMVGDRYVINLHTYPPAARADGGSPWGGLSGAAVFCGDLLTGVVAVDPAGRQHAALEAVPAYVLLADARFVEIVSAEGTVRCEAIELHGLVDTVSRIGHTVTTGSPAALLTARRAVVPFRGRAEILAELHAWARAPGLIWLLHGRGGQGKTRLAHQFGGQLIGKGWTVLWLDPARSHGDELAVLAETVTPLLVVLDYAETRTGQLRELVQTLARRRHAAPVKVLLLARTAGDWWAELAESSDVVRDLVDTTRIRLLGTLDETAAGQADSYRIAVTAFAAALPALPGQADVAWHTIAAGLGDPPASASVDRQTVLAAQMSALADLLDHGHPETAHPETSAPVGGKGPEDRILDHERAYWRATATAQGLLPGLGLPTLIDVVAAAVLLSPAAMNDLDALIAKVPGIADQPRDRRAAVRSWLGHLYPSAEGEFEGLQPDRLGERLIGRLILDHTRTCVIDSLATNINDDEAVTLLTVCTRAAAHPVFGDQVAASLTSYCTRHADTMFASAIETATRVERPHPLIRAVEQHASDEGLDTEQLERLSSMLPETSQVWASTSATLWQDLVQRRRHTATSDPETADSHLARGLNNLSNRLSELGRREEALDAITEAVEIRRRLAEQHPDAFLPDLAGSLNNLSNRLSELGRREEALDAITEAVEIRRRLAEQHPDAFLPDLAGSLNNLAVRLGALGRQEEGLDAITEAVGVYRRLAEQRPDAFLADVAMSLNNLAVRLGALGRREEGLDAITEAVGVYRRLAEQRPDAFLADVAMSLNNLAVRLGELGRREEGLDAITEAVEIRRRLAEQRPDVFLPDLAGSLNNLSIRLSELGRQEEGLDAITEAVEIRRRLAEQRPDAFLPDLAGSLNNLSIRLSELGRQEEGLDAITEAVEIRRRLAEQRPDVHANELINSRRVHDWLVKNSPSAP
ncbi:tetratricopeptide repeat-containing serine protease family protein [Saccharothrix sp. AJ9571]|nr:tetratricopeptide repeat-containing serine protease family protein [Saccharothrix sp. AJ9571]